MNGRKLAAFALSGVMAVGLTACGGNGEPNESPAGGSGGEAYLVAVSYTHLTLPTIYSV